MRFPDRLTAGAILGCELADLAPPDPVVLALPRGGVPVGFAVSEVMGCPLDVLVVRKLGVPFQPELAMGALGEAGIVVRNEEIIVAAGISEETFDDVVRRELAEIELRLESYRRVAEPIPLSERTAIIVDDGLATGATALAAVRVLREVGPSQIWLAVPVAPRDTTALMQNQTNRVVVLSQPAAFGAVGVWYRDFGQTTDEEVKNLLAESRLR